MKDDPLDTTPRATEKGRPRMVYVERLEVGESVFVPKHPVTIRSHIRRTAAAHGCRVTVRKATENGIHGARIWRIA